jgi:hypothetical protein
MFLRDLSDSGGGIAQKALLAEDEELGMMGV